MNKPYNALSDFLKEKFGERIYKIPVDGGFNCPNRDGTCGHGGCIFCNERGSGEHTLKLSIPEQVLNGIEFAKSRKKGNKFIAYFQNFTNTYAPVPILKEKYNQAFVSDDVIGLAVATRPDCIDEATVKLLAEIAKTKYVWVELGLQTANDSTALSINRGYKSDIYTKVVTLLSSFGIDVVVHLIIGLPNEDMTDIQNTVDFINKTPFSGIKIHSLYILKDSVLSNMFFNGNFTPVDRDYYIKAVSYVLTHIPETVVVHRLTGDGEKDKIIAPLWTTEKKKNLNLINMYMNENGLKQGCFYKNII